MLLIDNKQPLLIANSQRKQQQQHNHPTSSKLSSEINTLDISNTMAATELTRRRTRTKQQQQQLATKLPQINSRNCLIVLAIFSTIQLLPLSGHQRSISVVCQGFEDLNSNNKQLALGNLQQQQQSQNTFQPSSNRQQQQNANQRTFQRPILSTRFAPSNSGSGLQQQQQQPLSAQASFSASVYSEPPTALPSAAGSSFGQQQQPQTGGSESNIEQLMKNALARTAQMNSAAAEPRQDSAPQMMLSSAQQQQQSEEKPLVTRSVGSDKSLSNSESSEAFSGDTSQPSTGSDDGDRQTTAAQTTVTNAHDTVYTDQRFANLFARRNMAKKRLQPTEQVKAKPTLPSFIKSPPDPKQFGAASQAAASENGNGRPASPTGGNSFASQRLIQQQQQQQQGRINLANQQKKAAIITSNSAASAQNKRANALNNSGKPATNPTSAPIGSRSSSSSASSPRGVNGAAISKPSATPPSNNPFSRSQQGSSSDPANVIAMARKRLLANNALETAKLKQQQQQQQQQQNSNKPIAN